MEPTSFTRTNFCGIQVDNITENEAKQYILNQMSLRCSGMSHKSRYAKVYNESYKGNLSNPHVVCLKSSGTPYLMFITQINETNYTFLIDKKIQEGYSYPKIFIVPYTWAPEVYEGTLMECELIRDRAQKWFLSIGDMYYEKGTPMNQMVIIERINHLHRLVSGDSVESGFSKTCTLCIKRYFDYKDIMTMIHEFVPTLSYDIRGCYFVPMRCSYAKIVLLLPRDNPMNGPPQGGPLNGLPQGGARLVPAKRAKQGPAVHTKQQDHGKTTTMAITPNIIKHVGDIREFRIMKTLKPDVYEVYSEDQGHFKKHGLLLVQTSAHSQLLYDRFRTQGEIVKLPCVLNERFNKWAPAVISS